MAGADFIKTSTGKEVINATLPVGIVMCRAIKDFKRQTGRKVGITCYSHYNHILQCTFYSQVGFKPAGGIKTAQDALEWMVLVKEEMGDEWLSNVYFRIGASSLLDNISTEIFKIYQANNQKKANDQKKDDSKKDQDYLEK